MLPQIDPNSTRKRTLTEGSRAVNALDSAMLCGKVPSAARAATGGRLGIGRARNTGEVTLVEAGATRLSTLSQAALPATVADNVVNVFHTLTQSWNGMTLDAASGYRSDIADDGAPFEFCVAISKHAAEVQFYVEPRPATSTADYDPEQLSALLADFSAEYGLPLDRLRAVERLFIPDTNPLSFVLWIGGSFVAGRAPQFKVYLNPCLRGVERAKETTAEAMAMLGFERAWRHIETACPADSARHPAILCLDLASSTRARVKVYIRHPEATVGDLDRAVLLAQDRVVGDAQRFYQALARNAGPFVAKPPITELAFVDPTSLVPASCTLEFPLNSYVSSDGEACTRVKECLRAFGLPTLTYERAARALAFEPLSKITGMHAHVTLRRLADGEPRIGTYFASGAFGFAQPSIGPLAPVAAHPSPRSLCR